MKTKKNIQQHPDQEDKSGKATYASTTRRNSSTNKSKAEDVNMPQGAESEYKEELLKSKKDQSTGVSDKKPKQ